MCGRARSTVEPESLASAAGIPSTTPLRRSSAYHRRHNAHPGNATPVVYNTSGSGPAMRSMRWGLVPSYTKRGERPNHFRMFNARSETVSLLQTLNNSWFTEWLGGGKTPNQRAMLCYLLLHLMSSFLCCHTTPSTCAPGLSCTLLRNPRSPASAFHFAAQSFWCWHAKWREGSSMIHQVREKPVFSRLLRRKRCVVGFDGFYEWMTDREGKKQPYYVSTKDGGPLLMAALYDTWRQPEGLATSQGMKGGRERERKGGVVEGGAAVCQGVKHQGQGEDGAVGDRAHPGVIVSKEEKPSLEIG
ncbi:unnamed protein product, partial [Discosporangium mesarthrocarpum]